MDDSRTQHHSSLERMVGRTRLLPSRPEGYYREFVHPTPGVRGPGPQRVVQGQGGELFYSPDHYGTSFR